MYSLEEFDAYSRGYLLSWEKKSTVRNHERTRLDLNSIEQLEFTFPLKQYLEYPEIKSLPQKDLHPFYLQWLCDMLSNVARNEVEVIADLCSKLANQNLGIELSNAIKQVAITIATDEYYHAYVAREMLADFEELIGCVPAGPKKPNVETNASAIRSNKEQLPQRLTQIEHFKNSVPQELSNIALIVLLCILENFVVDEFVVMAENKQNGNPFSTYHREHLQDEGRHKAFFQKLLSYIWSAISEEDRIILGQVIADYAIQFFPRSTLEKRIQANTRFLSKFNIPNSAVQSIAYDAAITESSKPLCEDLQIKCLMSLMNVAGITSHAPTYQMFLDNDLIAA